MAGCALHYNDQFEKHVGVIRLKLTGCVACIAKGELRVLQTTFLR